MPGRLDPQPIARRDFLGLAGLWTAGVAVVGSLLGMAQLPKPRLMPGATSRFRVGRPEDFPQGTAKIIPGRNVRMVATEQGIAAISMICTHLGCIVTEDRTGFACPCHGSQFTKDGKVAGGPAPRGLPWLEVSRAVDGHLLVDSKREVPPGTYLQA